jgi:hypothetical protein
MRPIALPCPTASDFKINLAWPYFSAEQAAATAIATPAAMCGRSCRNGARPRSVRTRASTIAAHRAAAVAVRAWSFLAPVSASVLAQVGPASMSRRAAIAARSLSSAATAACAAPSAATNRI